MSLLWLAAAEPTSEVLQKIIRYLAEVAGGARAAEHLLDGSELVTRIRKVIEDTDPAAESFSLDDAARYYLAACHLKITPESLTRYINRVLNFNHEAQDSWTESLVVALCRARPGFTSVLPGTLWPLFQGVHVRASAAFLVLDSIREHGASSADACARAVLMLFAWKDRFEADPGLFTSLLRRVLHPRRLEAYNKHRALQRKFVSLSLWRLFIA